ncbi:hypothetical protein L7F22_030161 [Adiantum nelumboides]|nr:hypothetical protein [Adiantum nelumboides]
MLEKVLGQSGDAFKQRLLHLQEVQLDRLNALQHYEKMQDKALGKINKKIKDKGIKKGDLVLRYNSKLDKTFQKKLQVKWEGPFKVKSRWCTPYVPFETKTVFGMTKAQAHEVYNLLDFGVDAQLLIEANFINKDWLKCFKKVPKRGSKVKCRDVKPEHSNKFDILFTFVYQELPGNYGKEAEIGSFSFLLCTYTLRQMTKTLDHLEAPQETPIYTVDDVQKKSLFGPSSLTELDIIYNMVVSKHSFALSEYNEAFKKLELLQADVHKNEGANLLVEKLQGQLKDAEAALVKAEDSVDVVDAMHVEELKKAEPNAEVEIVGGYNCEDQDPKVEVHVEKEGVLEKDSHENGDQAENCPSMKNNEVSATDTSPSILQTIQMIQRERKRRMIGVNSDGAARKPTEDVEGQTKTSKDQVEKETGEISNMESRRKDTATNTIDNLDHIISMIAKSTMKDPPDVDTSFRVVMQVVQVVQVKTWRLSMKICEDTIEPPQENGDASMDARGNASCGGGAVGVGGAGEGINVGGDASCAGGAVGASATEYVRHDDGTVPHSWEDGGDARGVVGYVRNDDGTVSCSWEDPRNILFERRGYKVITAATASRLPADRG